MTTISSSTFDFAIVGAGVVGLASALGLAQQGFRVALVAPAVPAGDPLPEGRFDPRVYALSSSSVDLLQRLGVWGRIDTGRTAAVEHMRVFGDDGPELDFDAYAATVERLATIVEESQLVRVLNTACEYQPSIERVATSLAGLSSNADVATLDLGEGRSIEARVVIGADGAQSAVRAAAGINATTTLYGQTALVANFECERPHLQTAWQWFCDEGVVALLPLPSTQVSLVWSAPDAIAAQLIELSGKEFATRVTGRSSGALGKLQAAGPVQAFPLRLLTVDHLIKPRVVLVGDAAHVIHPLAGQGLNLGLQDVAEWLDTVRERESFRAIGDPVLLRRYERRRAEAIGLMRLATDGLARLFGSSNSMAQAARNTGLAVVNRLTPLKSLLIRRALG